MGTVNPNTTSVVPAGPSNAPAASSSTSATVQPAPLPVSALTILNGMFSTLSNDAKFSNLCMSKDNWPKWSQKIVEVMEMSELDEYIHGTVPAPDINADPTSFKNWKGNNKKLIGFLKAFVEDGEKSFLATENAHTAWQNLLARHEKQGPTTQVRLIQEVLSMEKGKEDYIWELQRGLYGLPQGGRIWNKAMNAGMVSLGFTRIKCEYCLYYRKRRLYLGGND
jgi:hypothetical protein